MQSTDTQKFPELIQHLLNAHKARFPIEQIQNIWILWML
jgi:hypothetical protein